MEQAVEMAPDMSPARARGAAAVARSWAARLRRIHLPPEVPQFNTRVFRLFTVLWCLVFGLAVVGPMIGLYYRYTAPENNSQLLLGSRVGLAVAPWNATVVRYTVGPEAQSHGIQAGDRIVAVYGLPVPKTMDMSEESLAEHGDDPAYIALGNVLFGTDSTEVPLTIRTPQGKTFDVSLTSGEQHIDNSARALGVGPKMLKFIDLLHVIFYPFLLWAAWILHRRNSRDAVSSILSLAVLCTIAAEQPSSTFLVDLGIPRAVNVALFDIGNMLLLAGIILFPHGRLSWRIVALLAALPSLMFLEGRTYQVVFVGFMVAAVWMLLWTIRHATSSELRQQVRWALFGFTGYAVLRGISILSDYFKWNTGSFGHQLVVEIIAGVALALAVLILQLGLLVALLRFRLYDADVVISRSANFALIALAVAAIFGAAADALKQVVYNYFGNSNSEGPVVIAAAIATILINPIQERIHRWSENRFQRNLVLLRDDLPECVRDMRETASLCDMLDEILLRVERGVRSVWGAIIIGDQVCETRNISAEQLGEWRSEHDLADIAADDCVPKDRLFPIRVPLVPSFEHEEPIGFLLVGPRPDGSIPSRDEQGALAGVSQSIARAIRTVIKREAREKVVLDMIESNRREIADLRARLVKANASPRSTRTA